MLPHDVADLDRRLGQIDTDIDFATMLNVINDKRAELGNFNESCAIGSPASRRTRHDLFPINKITDLNRQIADLHSVPGPRRTPKDQAR